MGAGQGKYFDSEFYKKVLDELHTNIYLTDMETDEIVYMNETMKETFQISELDGRRCWEILQKGMDCRCSFCRKTELEEGRKVCIWNENNSITGRIYQNYDSLIRWEGKKYHIQNSADVTEYRQLIQEANIDELTGLLNRRAGKEKLSGMLQDAREKNAVLSVALYDVNELKQVNDRYGHGEGDHLLLYITENVKHCLSSMDLLFRLSGDEFVAAFYNEDAESADRRIKAALARMNGEKGQNHISYETSFSYGLVEIYPSDNCDVTDIIAQADERMYVQKKKFHIMRAQKELEETGQKDDAPGTFHYDREHLFDALKESTDDYIFVGNMQTGIFRYSPSMVKEFGLPGEVVENAAAFWGRLIHPHDKMGFLESNQEIADGRVQAHCIEYRAQNVRGEWIWLRCRGRMIRDGKGEPSLFAGFITNLGKREQADHVTGLPRRSSFEGCIKKALLDDRTVKRIGVMILDMDSFKNINELYDQAFGDGILRLTAGKIAELLPENAQVFRLDGDEFGVVVLNGEEGEYERIYESIHRRFQKQQEYNGRKYYCTISAGYASCPEDADNYLDLVKCAGYSLEYSKQRGKNRATGFFKEILEEKERKLELSELLRESIERGFAGFSVRYQPQVHAQTGELYGAEALARWRCSKYGEVSPVEFIPLLEQSGMILPLGKWILRQAAGQCRKWHKQRPNLHMSVNLSYRQLQEENLAEEVDDILAEFELSPDDMTLELTETCWMKADEGVSRVLDKLRKLGIRLAMDDFGVGYSSLFSLKCIPVDAVKIDRGFVKGISTDLFNATFIRSISELCHDVGKKVCLEGVEEKEEYDVVKQIGVDWIQGFYFGLPVTDKDFEKQWFIL